MVGRKRAKLAHDAFEEPVDLAARIGVAGPAAPASAAVAEPPRRLDGPIAAPERARFTAPRGTPTDERGRPLFIGAEEPAPAPVVRAAAEPRSGRPVMIGVEEAMGAKLAAAAAADAFAPDAPAVQPLDELSLVATPLATPDDWHHFELALRRLRGVSAVRAEYYRAGILKLRLRWTGGGRFDDAVTRIPGYRVGILGMDRTTVQVRVARA